jgi:hypothetical protein
MQTLYNILPFDDLFLKLLEYGCKRSNNSAKQIIFFMMNTQMLFNRIDTKHSNKIIDMLISRESYTFSVEKLIELSKLSSSLKLKEKVKILKKKSNGIKNIKSNQDFYLLKGFNAWFYSLSF